MKLAEAWLEAGFWRSGGEGGTVAFLGKRLFSTRCPGEMSPAMTPRICMLPYQGQLLSELDDHPLVCSGQGNEIKHNEAATQGEGVTRVSVPFEGRLEKQLDRFRLQQFYSLDKDNPHLFQTGHGNSQRGE